MDKHIEATYDMSLMEPYPPNKQEAPFFTLTRRQAELVYDALGGATGRRDGACETCFPDVATKGWCCTRHQLEIALLKASGQDWGA